MPLAYRIVICYIDLTSVVLDKNSNFESVSMLLRFCRFNRPNCCLVWVSFLKRAPTYCTVLPGFLYYTQSEKGKTARIYCAQNNLCRMMKQNFP